MALAGSPGLERPGYSHTAATAAFVASATIDSWRSRGSAALTVVSLRLVFGKALPFRPRRSIFSPAPATPPRSLPSGACLAALRPVRPTPCYTASSDLCPRQKTTGHDEAGRLRGIHTLNLLPGSYPKRKVTRP